MKAEDFRRVALSLPEASESAHVGHPDFRVGGKIFATLGYPNDEFGVAMLSPEQQEEFVRKDPESFAPANGAGQTRQHCDSIGNRGRGHNAKCHHHRMDENRTAASHQNLRAGSVSFAVALLHVVFTQQRRTSATLQACAMQPRGVCGSASKTSLIVPRPVSLR